MRIRRDRPAIARIACAGKVAGPELHVGAILVLLLAFRLLPWEPYAHRIIIINFNCVEEQHVDQIKKA